MTLLVDGNSRQVGVGRTHKGTHVILLIQDLNVRVANAIAGELRRELTIDPSRDYQPPERAKIRKPQRGFGSSYLIARQPL